MSSPRVPYVAPSSIANQSQNIPSNSCCCFTSRFVNLVLFIFNFIFLFSGAIILLLTLLYGRPEVSRYLGETTKHLNNIISLMGSGHLVQIIHYSMLFCGVVISAVSLINIAISLSTSWSKSSDYYYYRRKRKLNNDNENLLYTSTLDSSTSNRSTYSTTHRLTDGRNSAGSSSMSSSSPTNTSRNAHRKHFWVHCANSPYALCVYIFILLLLFTIQLVIGLLSVMTVSPQTDTQSGFFFLQSYTSSSRPKPVTHRLVDDNNDDDDFLVSIRESVNIPHLLQDRSSEIESLYGAFHCCGWLFYDDYEYLRSDGGGRSSERNRTAPVPDACCKTYVKGCGQRKHPNNIYYDGCWSKFGAELRDYVLMLGWMALGFSVVELIGLMFAVCHYIQTVSRNQHSGS